MQWKAAILSCFSGALFPPFFLGGPTNNGPKPREGFPFLGSQGRCPVSRPALPVGRHAQLCATEGPPSAAGLWIWGERRTPGQEIKGDDTPVLESVLQAGMVPPVAGQSHLHMLVMKARRSEEPEIGGRKKHQLSTMVLGTFYVWLGS